MTDRCLLDHSAYPHIVELILSYPSSWLALRQASRYYREQADARMFRHIVFNSVVTSPYSPLPIPPSSPRDWKRIAVKDKVKFTHLLKHVRIVDLHGDYEEYAEMKALIDLLTEVDAVRCFGSEFQRAVFNDTCLKATTKTVSFPPPMGVQSYWVAVFHGPIGKAVTNVACSPRWGPRFTYDPDLSSTHDRDDIVFADEFVYIFHEGTEPHPQCPQWCTMSNRTSTPPASGHSPMQLCEHELRGFRGQWYEFFSHIALSTLKNDEHDDSDRQRRIVVGFPTANVDLDLCNVGHNGRVKEVTWEWVASQQDIFVAQLRYHLQSYHDDKEDPAGFADRVLEDLVFLSHDEYRGQVGENEYDFETKQGY